MPSISILSLAADYFTPQFDTEQFEELMVALEVGDPSELWINQVRELQLLNNPWKLHSRTQTAQC
eukprot:SAG11_NODE_346_length_10432_cov_4.883770_5_plen_65_part_00